MEFEIWNRRWTSYFKFGGVIMLKNILFTVTFTCVVFAGSAFGQNIAAKDMPVQKAVENFIAAQISYDQKSLQTLLTPDYLEVSPLGEVDKRDKVIGFYSAEAKAEASKQPIVVDASEEVLRNYGTFAVVILKLTYTIQTEEKKAISRGMRATISLRKIGKDWKIASTHVTGIRPPMPVAPKK